MGKPGNEEDSFNMLKQLSGKTHQVITGVSILSSEKVSQFVNVTEVSFYPLTEEEIHCYIKTKEPMDKAGAYAIQGRGLMFVKEIKGDYYSVMGLPAAEVMHRLKTFL